MRLRTHMALHAKVEIRRFEAENERLRAAVLRAEGQSERLRTALEKAWPYANLRRCNMIHQKHSVWLSTAEAHAELAALQSLADEVQDLLAPLPLEALEQVKAELQEQGKWEGES